MSSSYEPTGLPAGLRLAVNPGHVDLEAVSELLESVGMRRRAVGDLERALAASSDFVVVLRGDRVVGFGRLISDQTYYGSVWDVAVTPELQKQGIGRQIMERLLDRARDRELYMLGLFTGTINRRFYERLGFTFHDDVFAMTAMSAKGKQQR
ncbi:MAG: GNAT family N-acetyltransferase [Holophagales bacterium]|nr:GNAT family N-acetyltransferase [Holophagales bacterium]